MIPTRHGIGLIEAARREIERFPAGGRSDGAFAQVRDGDFSRGPFDQPLVPEPPSRMVCLLRAAPGRETPAAARFADYIKSEFSAIPASP